MASPQDYLEALNRLTGQQLGVLKSIQGVVGQINAALKSGGGGGGPAGIKSPKALPSLFERIGGTVGKVGKALGIVGLVAGAVTGAFAALPAAVFGVVKSATAFVRALNPSMVERYEREQDNLRATIGSGLTPIIAYATKSLREWAGILLPGIQNLKPVVERVSAVVSSIAAGPVRLLARLIEGAATGFGRMLPTIERFGEAFGAIFEVAAAIADAMNQLEGSILGTDVVINLVTDSFRKLVVAATVASARLLSLFGARDTLKRFRESLESAVESRRNPASGLTAAPKDATVGSIEDVLKRLNERAFIATEGGTAKRSEVDLLQELIGEVGKVEAKPKEWREVIVGAIREALNPSEAIGAAAARTFGLDGGASGGGKRAVAAGVGLLTNPLGTIAGDIFGGA